MIAGDERRRTRLKRAVVVALALGVWFAPPPDGLAPAAWHLFALFAAAIFSVVVGAFPILTASVFAVAAAVLTGTVDPRAARTPASRTARSCSSSSRSSWRGRW